jgi:hypothetical protein
VCVGTAVDVGVGGGSVVAVKVGRTVFVGWGEGVRLGVCVGGFVAVKTGGTDGVVLGDADAVGVRGGGECNGASVGCPARQPLTPNMINRPPERATKWRICFGILTKS